MSDAGVPDSMDGLQVPPSAHALTAGGMMRQAREAAGLHVAALAVAMKIPVKKLEALEADRLDLLHDAVFVRALAGSVCRALKIDPVPILNKLPLNTAPKLKSDELGINAPFHSSNGATGMSIPQLLKKPSTLAFVAFVLAGIIVFFLPDTMLSDFSGDVATQVNANPDNVSPSLVSQPSVPVSNTSLEPVGNTLSVPQTVDGVSGSLPAEVAARVQSSTPLEPAVVASQAETIANLPQNVSNSSGQPGSLPAVASSTPSSAALLPSTGTVVFKAKGATWVKVVDAKGVVQLSKTLSVGEAVGASGATPLSVVIGRVDATDVEVRGQSFNLLGVSRDNVARFEVK